MPERFPFRPRGISWGSFSAPIATPLAETLFNVGQFFTGDNAAALAIYDRFSTDFPAALALSAILVAVSAGLLLAVKLVPGQATLSGAAR